MSTQTSEWAFTTLGVPQTATEAECRRAYRKRVLQSHPDRHLGVSAEQAHRAEERMKELNHAWEILSEGFRAQPRVSREERAPVTPTVHRTVVTPTPSSGFRTRISDWRFELRQRRLGFHAVLPEVTPTNFAIIYFTLLLLGAGVVLWKAGGPDSDPYSASYNPSDSTPFFRKR